MRGINFLAGLGTILIFLGIFCFKALVNKKTLKEETEISKPLKNSQKALLVVAGLVFVALGSGLILSALKLI